MGTKRTLAGAAAPPAKRQANLKTFFAPRAEPPPLSPATGGAAASDEPAHAAAGAPETRPTGHTTQTQHAPDPAYPPASHVAYPPPPTGSYNHPFPLPAPPFPLSYTLAPRAPPSAPDLDLLHLPAFVAPASAERLFAFLLQTMPWYRVRYRVRGIDINTPRWTTVFGKDGERREWTGYRCRPRAIPPVLLMLMQQVEQATGAAFNFVLVNYYASGSDSISFHSDSEHFLGPDPTIASLSLGAPRDFHLRHKEHKARGVGVVKLTMRAGDMVVMRGKTQERWEHAIPKRAHAEGRINITFRRAVVKYGTENYNTYNVGSGPMYRFVNGHMVEQPRSGPSLVVTPLPPKSDPAPDEAGAAALPAPPSAQ